MPIISFRRGPESWRHSGGRPAVSIQAMLSGLLGSLLLLVIGGCAAETLPPAADEPRAPAETSDRVLTLPSKGPIGATVTLTVFENYQWGFCARLEPTLQQVLDEYPDTVKLVVKPFPDVNNQSSLVAASAVLAAHAQGKFWAFREQLFLFEGPLSGSDLQDIAEQVDIDTSRFFHDLSSDPILELLGRGINAGIQQGVRGTPTVFVNQTPMTSLRIEDFRQAIRQAALP